MKTINDLALEMAIKQVCPTTLNPTTDYEKNQVENYRKFALDVISEYCKFDLKEKGIDYSWENKMTLECQHENTDTIKICWDCGETFF